MKNLISRLAIGVKLCLSENEKAEEANHGCVHVADHDSVFVCYRELIGFT
jgi:hypothetical protein